jgi:hypothetical protein
VSVLGGDDLYLPLFEFSQRSQWPELTRTQIMKRYRFFRHSIAVAHPQANLAFGKAFLSKGDYSAAADALKTAAAQLGRKDQSVLPALLYAHVGAGDLAQASEVSRRLADGAAAGEQAAFKSLLSQMEALAGIRRHAVLVGIDCYRSRKLPGLKGAVNDAEAMRQVLVAGWGFAPKDVTLLCDKAAHRGAILSEFKRMAQVARKETAVFYFAGLGSTDHDRLPTIVSHDGRTKGVGDISLKELADLAGDGASNLVLILDAGFGGGALDDPLERTIRPDDRSSNQKSLFSNDEERRRYINDTLIGAFAIMHEPERW